MAGHINLQLGWPSPSLNPTASILAGAAAILKSTSKSSAALVYGPDAGYVPLRASIAKWLQSTYAPNSSATPDPERICVTNGASANLAAILARFTEPGYTQRIWMVEPSYFLACPIFVDAGYAGRLRGVPEDDEGFDIPFLRRNLEQVERDEEMLEPVAKTGPRYEKLYRHVIYAVPTFSNPSAKTMSLRRREELVLLAREYDALIVTDDVYDVLRWPQDPESNLSQLSTVPPRIVDVDASIDGGPKDQYGNAVSNGSFSKIIGPGIRTGWAEATPAFALALSNLGSTRSGGCPSHLTASFVNEMLESGALQHHIKETLVPTFRARYYTMMSAIQRRLIPLGFQIDVGKPYERSLSSMNGHTNGYTNGHADDKHASIEAGGYFTWILAPIDLADRVPELAAVALEKYNLKFAYGGMFQVAGDATSTERAREGYGRGLRLAWAWHTAEEIAEGIERLAQVIEAARK